MRSRTGLTPNSRITFCNSDGAFVELRIISSNAVKNSDMNKLISKRKIREIGRG